MGIIIFQCFYLQDDYKYIFLHIKSIFCQLIAMIEQLTTEELIRLYLTPGLVIEVHELGRYELPEEDGAIKQEPKQKTKRKK